MKKLTYDECVHLSQLSIYNKTSPDEIDPSKYLTLDLEKGEHRNPWYIAVYYMIRYWVLLQGIDARSVWVPGKLYYCKVTHKKDTVHICTIDVKEDKVVIGNMHTWGSVSHMDRSDFEATLADMILSLNEDNFPILDEALAEADQKKAIVSKQNVVSAMNHLMNTISLELSRVSGDEAKKSLLRVRQQVEYTISYINDISEKEKNENG